VSKLEARRREVEMDPKTIAASVVSLVRPFLGGLLTGAKPTAGGGVDTGGELREVASSMWDQLYTHLKDEPAALEAAQDVADHSDDDDAVASLQIQIAKVLAEDSVLSADLDSSLRQAEQEGVIADTTIVGGAAAGQVVGTDFDEANIDVGKVGGDAG
jgi:hypothetical protein